MFQQVAKTVRKNISTLKQAFLSEGSFDNRPSVPVSAERITKLWKKLKSPEWEEEFRQTRELSEAQEIPSQQSRGNVSKRRKKIFANNQVQLRFIKSWGFDYDYTLAIYNKEGEALIYDNILEYVVNKFGYPKELLKLEYDPDFITKGIQFDSHTGCFVKLDQFYKLGHFTVFHGRKKLETEEVVKLYGGGRVSLDYAEEHMKTLADSFTIPQGSALADIIEVLTKMNMDFDAKIVNQDVNDAVEFVHKSGVFHNTIIKDPERYIMERPKLTKFFRRLKDEGKNTFIVTNSKLDFVSAGSEVLLRETVSDLGLKNWTDIFDFIITDTRKPEWFGNNNRALRKISPIGVGGADKFSLTLDVLGRNEKHKFWSQGNLFDFTSLSGYKPEEVIYFGDNIPNDLSDSTSQAMWKTVGIVSELESEIEAINSYSYQNDLCRIMRYDMLIEECEREDSEEINSLRIAIKKDRETFLDLFLHRHFKTGFGSIFRTFETRSLFAYLLGQNSDLYTSSVTNFLEYPLHASFYPRRNFYSHEPNLWKSFYRILETPEMAVELAKQGY